MQRDSWQAWSCRNRPWRCDRFSPGATTSAFVRRARSFFGERIWDRNETDPLWKRLLFGKLRVLTLAWENGQAHGVGQHSAFLAFRSLTALVPFLAVVLVVFHAVEGIEVELVTYNPVSS